MCLRDFESRPGSALAVEAGQALAHPYFGSLHFVDSCVIARWLLWRAKLPVFLPFSEILSASTSKHRAVWSSCCLPWLGSPQVLHSASLSRGLMHTAATLYEILPAHDC